MDEHHLPVDAGHAQPLAGVALDGTAVYMIFLQMRSGPPLIWGFSSYFRQVTWQLLARLTTRGRTDSHGQLVNRPWESCIQRRIPWCRGHAAQQRPVSGAVRSQRRPSGSTTCGSPESVCGMAIRRDIWRYQRLVVRPRTYHSSPSGKRRVLPSGAHRPQLAQAP